MKDPYGPLSIPLKGKGNKNLRRAKVANLRLIFWYDFEEEALVLADIDTRGHEYRDY